MAMYMLHHRLFHYHMRLMLINRTLNFMSITQDGRTPLITAAFNGKCDVVLDLLESGVMLILRLMYVIVPASISRYACMNLCMCDKYMYVYV